MISLKSTRTYKVWAGPMCHCHILFTFKSTVSIISINFFFFLHSYNCKISVLLNNNCLEQQEFTTTKSLEQQEIYD